jgi:hypothetical protein
VPPHQLSLPVPTCLHRVPSPSLALASPSLGRVIPLCRVPPVSSPTSCPHRIPIFSPPRPDKVPAASCLCRGGRWSAPSRFAEGGRTRAVACLRSEGSGTSPTGARRRRSRRRRGELKGIGAGKSRAPRRQASGYLVGGPPGHAEDRPVRRVLLARVPPDRLPIRAEGDVPESRQQGEWARPTDERRARAREPRRPERRFAWRRCATAWSYLRCSPGSPLSRARVRARARPRRIRRHLLQRAPGSAPRPSGRADESAPASGQHRG